MKTLYQVKDGVMYKIAIFATYKEAVAYSLINNIKDKIIV
jgi:hypothetical protein